MTFYFTKHNNALTEIEKNHKESPIYFHNPENEYSDPDSSFSDSSSSPQKSTQDFQNNIYQGTNEYKSLIFLNIRKHQNEPNNSPLLIQENYREIAINWIIDSCYEMRMLEETLFSTVALFDKVTSKKNLSTNQILLFAATSLWIESKIEEAITPLLSDFVYLCGNRYQDKAFLKCEREILYLVEYSLTINTPIVLLNSFLQDLGIDSLNPINSLSKFFANSALFISNFQAMDPTTIALACLFLGYDASGVDGHFPRGKSLSSSNLIFKYANLILLFGNRILDKCSGRIFEDLYSILDQTNISFEAFRSNLTIPFSIQNVEDFLSENQ